jgi:hypothetical protein
METHTMHYNVSEKPLRDWHIKKITFLSMPFILSAWVMFHSHYSVQTCKLLLGSGYTYYERGKKLIVCDSVRNM